MCVLYVFVRESVCVCMCVCVCAPAGVWEHIYIYVCVCVNSACFFFHKLTHDYINSTVTTDYHLVLLFVL